MSAHTTRLRFSILADSFLPVPPLCRAAFPFAMWVFEKQPSCVTVSGAYGICLTGHLGS
jgi:hypothetical protein